MKNSDVKIISAKGKYEKKPIILLMPINELLLKKLAVDLSSWGFSTVRSVKDGELVPPSLSIVTKRLARKMAKKHGNIAIIEFICGSSMRTGNAKKSFNLYSGSKTSGDPIREFLKDMYIKKDHPRIKLKSRPLNQKSVTQQICDPSQGIHGVQIQFGKLDFVKVENVLRDLYEISAVLQAALFTIGWASEKQKMRSEL